MDLEIEHVIPVSYMDLVRKRSTKSVGLTTYACAKCNQTLGSRVFWQFHDRYDCARAAIHKAGRKAYRMPEWTLEELMGLDYSLRQFVQVEQAKKRHTVARVDWDGSAQMIAVKKEIEQQVKDEANDFVSEFLSHWLSR